MGKMRMQHCFNCGAEIGVYTDHEPLDTCGKRECEREARNQTEMERADAHERLDDDMGW